MEAQEFGSAARAENPTSRKTRDIGAPGLSAGINFPNWWGRLFQLHEEQHEDRPDSDGERELHQGGVAQRGSPGQREGQRRHDYRGQHSDDKPAFRVHFCSPPPGRLGQRPRNCLRIEQRLYTYSRRWQGDWLWLVRPKIFTTKDTKSHEGNPTNEILCDPSCSPWLRHLDRYAGAVSNRRLSRI